MTRPFYSNCVDWPQIDPSVDHLDFLIEESHEITRDTFLRLVDRSTMREIEAYLGYGRPGLTMANDPYVHYHREPATGIPFFTWSAIEYVFATPAEIRNLHETVREAQQKEWDAEAESMTPDDKEDDCAL